MEKKVNRYVDLTNNQWKNDPLIGLQITNRPYRRVILAVFLILSSISLIIPDLGLGMFTGFKILRRFG